MSSQPPTQFQLPGGTGINLNRCLHGSHLQNGSDNIFLPLQCKHCAKSHPMNLSRYFTKTYKRTTRIYSRTNPNCQTRTCHFDSLARSRAASVVESLRRASRPLRHRASPTMDRKILGTISCVHSIRTTKEPKSTKQKQSSGEANPFEQVANGPHACGHPTRLVRS